MLQRDVAPVLGPLGIFSIVGMATRSSARSIGRDPRARPDNAFDAIELAIGAVTAEKFSDLSVTCEAAQGLNADRRRKQLISFWFGWLTLRLLFSLKRVRRRARRGFSLWIHATAAVIHWASPA